MPVDGAKSESETDPAGFGTWLLPAPPPARADEAELEAGAGAEALEAAGAGAPALETAGAGALLESLPERSLGAIDDIGD